jgi:hypothetical protein
VTALLILLAAADAGLITAAVIADHRVTGPARTAPALDTCLGCDRPVPRGTTWCGWICRNFDDRHDAYDNLWGDDGE